jgi:8-oxo-dGTP diphosphatase
VPHLRNTTFVDVGVRTVAGALLEPALLGGSGGVLCAGDEVASPFGPVRVERADETGAEVVGDGLRLVTELKRTGGGTLVVDGLSFGGLVGRALALRVLAARARVISLRAEQLAAARVVVGAAIVRDGRLLVQQRAWPERDAGRWELPGGRVEPGESDAAALERECVEELDARVVAGQRCGPDVPLRPDLLLRVLTATLRHGEPRAVEHRAVRWVTAADLDTLPWLPADRALLPSLHTLLPPS